MPQLELTYAVYETLGGAEIMVAHYEGFNKSSVGQAPYLAYVEGEAEVWALADNAPGPLGELRRYYQDQGRWDITIRVFAEATAVPVHGTDG